MPKRPITKFRPGLEPLEERRPLSLGASTAPIVNLKAGARASAPHRADTPGAPGTVGDSPVLTGDSTPPDSTQDSISAQAVKPNFGYLVYRITNPNRFNNTLIPPFSHLLVQSRPPVPGQVYTLVYAVVRNGTARTFDASSGFRVRSPGQHSSFPILTGTEQWKPGQHIVFYFLTKQGGYYPVPNPVTSGFDFNLGGARSVAIPGPSGVFHRLQYQPATFDRTLDAIVAFGQGAEGGAGPRFGLPDTAIYEFLSAKTRRIDFSGYF